MSSDRLRASIFVNMFICTTELLYMIFAGMLLCVYAYLLQSVGLVIALTSESLCKWLNITIPESQLLTQQQG
jgi:hypothetical protein